MTKAERDLCFMEIDTALGRLLDGIREKNNHIAALEAQLAQRDERIRKLREVISYEREQCVYHGYNEDARRHQSPIYARLTDALAADAKAGEGQ